jgi:hypothetical protein
VSLEYWYGMNRLTEIPQTKCSVSRWRDDEALGRVGRSVCQLLIVTCMENCSSNILQCFAFMLPCIIIDLFLNNQPDANYPNLFCYKTLHVSDIFSAHHQEFSSAHLALVSFKQSQDGTAVPSWLCLEAVIKNRHETYKCRVYSRKLMMGREDAWNM